MTNPGGSNNCDGLWGTGPNDVWVACSQSNPAGAIQHWNGSSWSPITMGIDSMGPDAIWGSGPGDVSSGTTNDLYGVWGTGAEVWVVGYNTILHRAP